MRFRTDCPQGGPLCVLLDLCVWVCVCEYKGPVTACVWPGEIKEQIGLQITTAPRHHSKQWPLSDYHHQQWPWTQRSSWYGLWRDIMYRFRKKALHASDWDTLVAQNDLCPCKKKKKKEYCNLDKAKTIQISSQWIWLGLHCRWYKSSLNNLTSFGKKKKQFQYFFLASCDTTNMIKIDALERVSRVQCNCTLCWKW